MIDRIKINEERLDNISIVVKELEEVLSKFENLKESFDLLNEYYGSSEWFADKESLETCKIENVKAGVLSEDAVWNLIVDVKELSIKMNSISNEILVDSDNKD